MVLELDLHCDKLKNFFNFLISQEATFPFIRRCLQDMIPNSTEFGILRTFSDKGKAFFPKYQEIIEGSPLFKIPSTFLIVPVIAVIRDCHKLYYFKDKKFLPSDHFFLQLPFYSNHSATHL